MLQYRTDVINRTTEIGQLAVQREQRLKRIADEVAMLAVVTPDQATLKEEYSSVVMGPQRTERQNIMLDYQVAGLKADLAKWDTRLEALGGETEAILKHQQGMQLQLGKAKLETQSLTIKVDIASSALQGTATQLQVHKAAYADFVGERVL